jgi:molecular chaperone DnaK
MASERTTVDFGIDLGTTNSSIAVLDGTDVHVFKNNEGQEYTPSAVWIDNKDRLYVGFRAKQRFMDDEGNTKSEFKRQMGQMGTPEAYRFAKSGRVMRPQELSAEILKSLRGDVQQRTGEEVMAAVIGVPAAFELPQCEATNEAARLAGLSFSPLIQEPAAAAIAYGFQSKSDRVFWMVYDLGGGTFDVAIMQVRDGQIRLVNHGGDNELGGKNLDWEIVEQLLVPALKREYALSDFTRANAKWKSAFGKLKLNAEEAKIRLSRDISSPISIDPLCQDDRGRPVKLEYDLQRNDVERLIEPLAAQTINICKKVLDEKRLSPGDIEKLILVGGPTLTPLIRQMLSSALGMTLEFRIDPLTVVARGAAIFAGTQRTPANASHGRTIAPGQFRVELEYDHIGTDLEPPIGGSIIAPEGESLAGFTIEFVASKSQWRTGRINISAKGTFTTTIRAEKGCSNEYLIELRDSNGNLRQCVPDRFSYTYGMTLDKPCLTNSVGVAMANNQMDVFFKKGTPLPARQRNEHRTAVAIKRGDSSTYLRIPVVEGNYSRRADRNSPIGTLEVPGDKIRRDIPIGSVVEITIIIDESRLVRTKAYIPILDEEFEHVHKLEKPAPDPQQLSQDFEREKARLEQVSQRTEATTCQKAVPILERIRQEQMVHDIETSLAASKADPDAAAKCRNRLQDLKRTLDEIEVLLEWPTLVSGANQEIEYTRELVNEYVKDEHKKDEHKRDLNLLEDEARKAIAAQNEDLLHQKIGEVQRLKYKILSELPAYWVAQFNGLAEQKNIMRDKSLAEGLILQGRRAIDNNDLEGLKNAVRQLWDLMPPDKRDDIGYGGTTLRF